MKKALGPGLLLLGLVFCTLGLVLGQNVQVLGKAVMVCLECIGIG